jgi:hypothetical protein
MHRNFVIQEFSKTFYCSIGSEIHFITLRKKATGSLTTLLLAIFVCIFSNLPSQTFRESSCRLHYKGASCRLPW